MKNETLFPTHYLTPVAEVCQTSKHIFWEMTSKAGGKLYNITPRGGLPPTEGYLKPAAVLPIGVDMRDRLRILLEDQFACDQLKITKGKQEYPEIVLGVEIIALPDAAKTRITAKVTLRPVPSY